MKLYNFDPSLNPLKVRLALAELGLKYETQEVVLFKREQRDQTFLKVNPLGKVPVLVDNDLTLRESNAILYYLGKEYGRSLWPRSPQHEALAMQWLFFETAHMAPSFGTLWFNNFGMPKLGRSPQPQSELKEEIEQAEWALQHLENHFQANAYILGQEFSLVDCSIGAQLAGLKETSLIDKARWPATDRYLEQFVSRLSWQAARGNSIWDGPSLA